VVSSNRTSATRPPTTRRGSHDTMLAIATPFLRVGGWHAPARRADRTLMGPLAPAPLRSRSCPTRCVRTEPDSPGRRVTSRTPEGSACLRVRPGERGPARSLRVDDVHEVDHHCRLDPGGGQRSG
jgi:hypothetical protein